MRQFVASFDGSTSACRLDRDAGPLLRQAAETVTRDDRCVCMTPRSKLIGAVLGVIVLSVLAVVLAPANAPAPDAPDRNVPSATTGPGRNAID
jgi:hypothetical protein